MLATVTAEVWLFSDFPPQQINLRATESLLQPGCGGAEVFPSRLLRASGGQPEVIHGASAHPERHTRMHAAALAAPSTHTHTHSRRTPGAGMQPESQSLRYRVLCLTLGVPGVVSHLWNGGFLPSLADRVPEKTPAERIQRHASVGLIREASGVEIQSD